MAGRGRPAVRRGRVRGVRVDRRHPSRPPRSPRRKADETRPTSDRVRENAFNLIGPVDDADVLDLFAGSGALGLEALSPRRRRRATFVELDRDACRAIDANLDKLGLRGTVLCQDALRGRSQRARHLRPDPLRPALRLRPCAARAAPRAAPERGRAARLRDVRPRGAAGGSRASTSEPPASTAPHDLRCSSSDHRHLPRHVRPRHERARRRDHARRPDLRPRRRRRRREPAPQDADVRRRGAGRAS